MGVPRFFLWLVKKYKKDKFILNSNQVSDVDSLLIDTNCLLHPQCFKILAENPNIKNQEHLENMMVEECIKYLQYIIDFVNPSKEIYIAIDGVAPIAKIKQQRQRRFKSVHDKVLFDNIKKKHKKEITTYWNNAAISPGTVFMKKITVAIIEFCKNYENKKKIYFSSASTPGEGEHKLLQHIRKANNTYKYVVYGLDADLIFLSLTVDTNSIFLLRESQELRSDNKTPLSYICIDTLKCCIVNEVKTSLYDEFIERELEDERVIKDFIFICYFLGNDFLPHIPSIDISCFDRSNINGLDLLLQAYCNTYDNLDDYLVCVDNSVSYNLEFMQMFLEYLSLFEEDFFSKLYESKRYHKKLQSNDSFEIEKYKIENLNFRIENDINLGMDDSKSYKYRYYKKYYNADVNQHQTVKHSCYKYIEGLIWVAKYYFNECSSWEWCYPFDHAPFISDLADSFKRFNINDIKFNLGKPLNQKEQLLCILPPQSSYLLPPDMKWLTNSSKSPLAHLYPIKFEIDLLYKDKYWQGIPILPDLDIETVKKTCKSYKEIINDKILVFN